MTFLKWKQRLIKPKPKLGLYFLLMTTAVILITGEPMFLEAKTFPSAVAREEMDAEEKQKMIEQLLADGERYLNEKNYNLANATFESVFLLDPDNVHASGSLDQLKKRMLKEGKYETQLVGGVYDAEIDIRVRAYLKQAKQFLAEGKYAQARFTLQKLLLINPLHQEAQKLYNQLKPETAHPSV